MTSGIRALPADMWSQYRPNSSEVSGMAEQTRCADEDSQRWMQRVVELRHPR